MKIQSKQTANLNSCWSVLKQVVLPGMFHKEFLQRASWSVGGVFKLPRGPL